MSAKIYRCLIDGACCSDVDAAIAHMKRQHNLGDEFSFYVREEQEGAG